MNNRIPKIALAIACAFAALGTHAESDCSNGPGTLSATARLDLPVVVPGILKFRVGSAGAPIGQITFTVPPANVADGAPSAEPAATREAARRRT
jgi:hypothetical protein